MMTEQEFLCKLRLKEVGIPGNLIEEWYQAIFVKPDLSMVKREINEYIGRISNEDLAKLVVEFMLSGRKAGLEKAKEFFRELYGIQREVKLIYGNVNGAIARCETKTVNRRIKSITITVDAQNKNQLDELDTIGMMAHEMWHARQMDLEGDWLDEIGGMRIDLDFRPQEARREILYHVNQRCVLGSNWSEEMYARQLLEAEAYYLHGEIMVRLSKLSVHISRVPITELASMVRNMFR